MKKLSLLAVSLLSLSSVAFADAPTIQLSNTSTANQLSLNVTVNNASSIQQLQFEGLDGLIVLSREIQLNSASHSTSSNQYSSKLILVPTKAGNYKIDVKATLNGSDITSNIVNLTVSPAQVKELQQKITTAEESALQQVQQMMPQINQQLKQQQQFIGDVSKMIESEQRVIQGLSS